MRATDFRQKVLRWFDRHGRDDLPWQRDITPYRVWVSEIMLQQTRVATVIPYFERFMDAFPDVHALARASPDQVLHLWTGLGYYARARHLHRAAVRIVEDYDGEFPAAVEELRKLPGIGRSTAGAIASISMNRRAPILDGNVKRVLARFHAVPGWPGDSAVEKRLWALAEHYTPHKRVADYNQAMMDLGATLCTRTAPACDRCPLASQCAARAEGHPEAYPYPKPKKQLPVRATTMILVTDNEDRVLLEQRPPAGLWGGLWSFPELNDPQELPELLQRLGLHERERGHLEPFRHTFSHYHLDITPLKVRVRAAAGAVADDGRVWVAPDEPGARGLAAPVKKMLDRLGDPDPQNELF